MLKLLKYGAFLILFIISISIGITAFVVSDKEKITESLHSISLNISAKGNSDKTSENTKQRKKTSIFSPILYGGLFFVLLIIASVFYRFIFKTYSKKEGNQS